MLGLFRAFLRLNNLRSNFSVPGCLLCPFVAVLVLGQVITADDEDSSGELKDETFPGGKQAKRPGRVVGAAFQIQPLPHPKTFPEAR